MLDPATIAQVLIDLEHPDMTPDQDHRYQHACAHLAAQLADQPELWARLQRAAITCHHCNGHQP